MVQTNNTRNRVLTTLISIVASSMVALIQFLIIYWTLNIYGAAFTGFVRLSMSLATIGGTVEGALGLSTVVLLIKPMAIGDWISANEIISTNIKKNHKTFFASLLLIILVSILYPLQIVIASSSYGKQAITWGVLVNFLDKEYLIGIFQMITIVFILGFQNLLTSKIFGIYENIIMADQKNGLRKIIILFSDAVIYGFFLWLISSKYINHQQFLQPIFPFLVLISYAPLRGFLMMIYVKRHYSWIKFYSDFNSYALLRITDKDFRASLGQKFMISGDLILIFIALGFSSLTATSMLSLYMLVGVNLRLILTNVITSFREYFIGVLNTEGRLTWEAYAKYELYTFSIATFAFIFMCIISPYLVSGLYGKLIYNDLYTKLGNIDNVLVAEAEWNAFNFIFSNPIFSILYGTSVAFTLIVQGQLVLIQSKSRFSAVGNGLNIIACVYAFIEIICCLVVYFVLKTSNSNSITEAIKAFYIIKAFFMLVCYVYLWQFTWRYVTYNSTLKYILPNFICLILPIICSILVELLIIVKKMPLEIARGKIPKVPFSSFATLLLIVLILSIGSSFVLPLILQPHIAWSIISTMPIFKRILSFKKEESKKQRFSEQNINEKDLLIDQQALITKVLYGIDNDNVISEKEFLRRYKNSEKPKIYQIIGGSEEKQIDSSINNNDKNH